MTLTIDVEEGVARWRELLAAVEAGGEVVIARGSEAIAHVTKVGTPEIDRQAAIDAVLEMRKRMPRATAEDILEWRDEGRR